MANRIRERIDVSALYEVAAIPHDLGKSAPIKTGNGSAAGKRFGGN